MNICSFLTFTAEVAKPTDSRAEFYLVSSLTPYIPKTHAQNSSIKYQVNINIAILLKLYSCKCYFMPLVCFV